MKSLSIRALRDSNKHERLRQVPAFTPESLFSSTLALRSGNFTWAPRASTGVYAGTQGKVFHLPALWWLAGTQGKVFHLPALWWLAGTQGKVFHLPALWWLAGTQGKVFHLPALWWLAGTQGKVFHLPWINPSNLQQSSQQST